MKILVCNKKLAFEPKPFVLNKVLNNITKKCSSNKKYRTFRKSVTIGLKLAFANILILKYDTYSEITIIDI